MSWWLIQAALHGAPAEEVAAALVGATGHAVEERPATVLGYAADESAAARIGAELARRFGAGIAISTEPAGTTDWTTAWKDGFAVRTVGRLRVGPSWLLAPAGDAVVMDPETAFGSGEHGSTRGALALLERRLRPGATVLDLGSGSGILAIGAAKLGCRQALGIEVDEEAVPVAERNAVLNGVGDRVRFVAGDAAVLAPLAGPVDLVVSNILRSVNETLLGPIARSLGPGGAAVFAGMETAEAAAFRSALGAAGYAIGDEIVDDGWWSVAAAPPRS